jgi:hypothetical protein
MVKNIYKPQRTLRCAEKNIMLGEKALEDLIKIIMTF